jgi:hypothetical protein
MPHNTPARATSSLFGAALFPTVVPPLQAVDCKPIPSTTKEAAVTLDPDPAAALESLAAALDSARYAITFQSGRRPELTITNRRASMLTESVYVQDGWYRWAWGETLAPASDPARAAQKVDSVLCLTPEPAHR